MRDRRENTADKRRYTEIKITEGDHQTDNRSKDCSEKSEGHNSLKTEIVVTSGVVNK
jgi:hypothetical protein